MAPMRGGRRMTTSRCSTARESGSRIWRWRPGLWNWPSNAGWRSRLISDLWLLRKLAVFPAPCASALRGFWNVSLVCVLSRYLHPKGGHHIDSTCNGNLRNIAQQLWRCDQTGNRTRLEDIARDQERLGQGPERDDRGWQDHRIQGQSGRDFCSGRLSFPEPSPHAKESPRTDLCGGFPCLFCVSSRCATSAAAART